MVHVISTINLKGGVGKTTITVALAEFLSVNHGKKVLVIDLDPQTSATTVLIGETRWKELNDEGFTLATVFKDALRGDGLRPQLDLERTLQKGVSAVTAVQTVDLLPSSLDLMDVQDLLATIPPGPFYSNSPTEVLIRAMRPLIENYDYVLIDCPPNLGIVTLNGLRMSDGYIIPTIPDVLSTYGIPQILKRVGDFSRALDADIVPLGIAVTKYRQVSVVHTRTVQDLIRRSTPEVFRSYIPEANDIAASAEYAAVSTLRQKYGANFYDPLKNLTTEFLDRVEKRFT